jgi:sterol desaturase/sphingolipid hydroxylase (fatty acid hydroxylase superfamily)
MQNPVETLSNLTPAIILAGMTTFMTLETWRPYFRHGAGRRRQRWQNVGMIAISVPLGAVAGGLTALPVAWSEANDFGLLHRVLAQSPLAVALGVFVTDLCAYAVHITLHKVPALWRVHRVHHADTELDASSAIRLHPFELLLLLGSLSIALSLVGVSVLSSVIYNTIALPWFLLNHSNLKYPAWF